LNSVFVYFVDFQTSLMYRTVRQGQVCCSFAILSCSVFMGWSRINCTNYKQGSYRPWKVLELKCWDFQAWKSRKKA